MADVVLEETEDMNTAMKNWNGYEICDEKARNNIEKVAAIVTPITWGTEEAPATGTPNTIYIQIN